MFVETTCNATLERLLIEPGNDRLLLGPLTFHHLALIVGGSSSIIAICLSLYLAFMHAINYTKPEEQRHIIRILFMVPVFSISSFLQIYFYRFAIYFQLISDCYTAFALASFFALMCHYVAPDLHEQQDFFRDMYPVKNWVWPVNWLAFCCCGQSGPLKSPQSGLTWFNITWVGIYQYCVIRIAMTITAVVTQHFGQYCETNNSPLFAHVWVLAINGGAVAVAMYCLVQFYVQMRRQLEEHSIFLKILAIKLVIFLPFWQLTAVAIVTNEMFKSIESNAAVAYSDIKIGSPSAILCFEMALFAILQLWAFPYAPYTFDAKIVYYPSPDEYAAHLFARRENIRDEPSGGVLGLMAFVDAMNPWYIVKSFARGTRSLLCGGRNRHQDDSDFKDEGMSSLDLDNLAKPYPSHIKRSRSTEHLPIADQFRRSRFGIMSTSRPGNNSRLGHNARPGNGGEDAGLIAHAQPNPTTGMASHGMTSSPMASPYLNNGAAGYGVASSPMASPYPSNSYPNNSANGAAGYGVASSPMASPYLGNSSNGMDVHGMIPAPLASPYPRSSTYGMPSPYRDTSPLPSPSAHYGQNLSPYSRMGGGRDWEPSDHRPGAPGSYGNAF